MIGKLDKFYIDKKTGEKHYNYYLVMFEDGYITETEYRALRHGKIKNPNIPSVYGVGFIGAGENNSGNSQKHTREYEIWKKMLQRCYDNEYQKIEQSYIGVSVDKRWHNFQNFCTDIKDLYNYDKWRISTCYELDKDILCDKKGINPKIYSKETCMFVEKKLNISYTNHKFKKYIGIRIDDGYMETFTCFTDFATKWGLNPGMVSGCLNGRYKTHKGWFFKEEEEETAMNDINIFEYAVRKKIRFPYKGLITVEDLFDLPLEGLDSVFKTLNDQLKSAEEKSLLTKKNPDDEILAKKIDIVKYIFETKQAEANDRLLAKAKKEQKEKIMSIMAAKQDEELQGKSIEDLQKMLDSMDI